MNYKYWDYYLSLENDLIATKRYVDFSKNNTKTNSIEFARIILASCAEIDMIFKELCSLLTNKKCKNITNYRKVVLGHDPSFNIRERNIAYTKVPIIPFQAWNLQNGNNPDWWRSYNAIKHERSSSFNRASLENAILSLAGLQIVLFEFYIISNNSPTLSFDYKDVPKLILPKSQGSSQTKNGFTIQYST